MDFERLIKERYSVRNFKCEKLRKEDIDKILNAAHLAPTGCNYQPQRIIVVNSEEAIEKLKNCTRCHFNAPNAFIVCHNKEESWKRPYDGALASPVDATIVATHMMLEAHNIGVGCCFVMHFNPFILKEAFNIPDNIEPVALLIMGYPADDAKPLPLHFNTRPMDEVVFWDEYKQK